jgi:multidrug resistance efflux pump
MAGLSFLALVAAIFTWRQRAQLPPPSPVSNVRVAAVRPGVVDSTLRLAGVTVSPNSVTLRAPEGAPYPLMAREPGGRAARAAPPDAADTVVLQDVVPAGTVVAAGQIVARFERRVMPVRLEAYRAAVAEREAALRTAKADLEAASRARLEQLTSAEAALDKARADMRAIPVLPAVDAERTRIDFDEAQARYQQLQTEAPLRRAAEEADLRAAELDLETAKLELRRAEEGGEATVVTAPASGMVVLGNVGNGGERRPIRPGDEIPAGQPFLRVAGSKATRIEAVVNEVDLSRVQPGSKVSVRFDAYPSLTLPATVESVGSISANAAVREAPVWLNFDRTDDRVIPDLSVSCDVELAPAEASATVIPRGALFRGSQGTQFVFVKTAHGWNRRVVEIARSNEIEAAISRGLNKGDVVALEWPFEAKQ